ncbi:hypothetical protein D3C72_2341150 [compost metagenome]
MAGPMVSEASAKLPALQQPGNLDRRADHVLTCTHEAMHKIINLLGDLGCVIAQPISHGAGVGDPECARQLETDLHRPREGRVRDEF